MMFLANNKKKVTFEFFLANTFVWSFFLPIQIQIYLVVPKIGQCEYKYEYSDWNLKENKYEYELNICLWI